MKIPAPKTVWRLFAEGFDTRDIAAKLWLTEGQVYNLLSQRPAIIHQTQGNDK